MRGSLFIASPWARQPVRPFTPVQLHGSAPLSRSSAKLGQELLRCWKTDNGGTICSNLLYYSPNCPDTPQVIMEGQVLPTPPEAPGAS